jgi:hypothetical protein
MKTKLIAVFVLLITIGCINNADAQLFGRKNVNKARVKNSSNVTINQTIVDQTKSKESTSCIRQVQAPTICEEVCKPACLPAPPPPAKKCQEKRTTLPQPEIRIEKEVVTETIYMPQKVYVPVPAPASVPVPAPTMFQTYSRAVPQGCPPGSRTVNLGGTFTFIPPEQRPTYHCEICGGTHPVGVYHKSDPRSQGGPVVVQTPPRYVNVRMRQQQASPQQMTASQGYSQRVQQAPQQQVYQQGYSQYPQPSYPVQNYPIQQSNSSSYYDSNSSSFHQGYSGNGTRSGSWGYNNNWNNIYNYSNSWQN